MRVDVDKENPALLQVIKDSDTTIFMDANFFMAPDRSALGIRALSFDWYREAWLEPLFQIFGGLSVHESVYQELVADDVRRYADLKHSSSRLRIFRDASLSARELALMQSYMAKIAPHSQYLPEKDNAKDRGEVRSLSYMAAKGFLYFAANDALPVRLIENAAILKTGLDGMGILKMYEVIHYLFKRGMSDGKSLRALYKYQYYLTQRERGQNPGWGEFLNLLDALYGQYV